MSMWICIGVCVPVQDKAYQQLEEQIAKEEGRKQAWAAEGCTVEHAQPVDHARHSWQTLCQGRLWPSVVHSRTGSRPFKVHRGAFSDCQSAGGTETLSLPWWYRCATGPVSSHATECGVAQMLPSHFMISLILATSSWRVTATVMLCVVQCGCH